MESKHMAFCTQCGNQLEENAAFCPQCGKAVTKEQAQPEQEAPKAQPSPEQSAQQPFTPPPQSGSALNDFVQNIGNSADTTSQFDPMDVARNKSMAVLSYIGLLFLIPLLAAKESPFAQFHAKQGVTLFILEIAVNIVLGVIRAVFRYTVYPLYVLLGVVVSLAGLAFLALMIVGIVNAANGKAKELPVIGGLQIIK